MEKRIGLESRGKEPSQVVELNLDNVRTVGEFEGLTNEFTNLEKLSVIKAGLTSFKGFPTLLNLKKLDVSENRISSGLNLIKPCTSLNHLCLSNNKFKDIESLEPLKSLPALTHLEVANNPFTESEEYRSRIFSMLPNLELVDNVDKEGNEAESEDEDEEDTNGPAQNDANGESHNSNGLEEDGDDEDDADEDDELEEEEEDDESEEEDGPGLADLYNNPNLEDGEDGDYDEEQGGEDDDEDIEDEEEEDAATEAESTRGKKRKHEEEAVE